MTAGCPEIVGAGWSVLTGALVAVLVALQALGLCLLWWSWHWGIAAAAGVLAGYAGAVALGYFAGRRFWAWLAGQERSRNNAPLRPPAPAVVYAIAVLCGMSSGEDLHWALVMGVLLLVAVLPAAGMAAGFWLAMVALESRTDFRGALGVVRRRHYEARRAEWDAAMATFCCREAAE